MNKPCGYVCSAVSDSHKTVYELLDLELQKKVQGEKRGQRLHSVGRLDCDTSGLLLFTNDGYFSDFMTRSQNRIEKKYQVLLQNPLSQEEQAFYIEEFNKGILLPPDKKSLEEKALPAKIEFIYEDANKNECEKCLVTVMEGKFHLVRRMFLALGNRVLKLKRISMGPYILADNLKEGEYCFVKALL